MPLGIEARGTGTPDEYDVSFWVEERAGGLDFISNAAIRRIIMNNSPLMGTPHHTFAGTIRFYRSPMDAHMRISYPSKTFFPPKEGFGQLLLMKALQHVHREMPAIKTIVWKRQPMTIQSCIQELGKKIGRETFNHQSTSRPRRIGKRLGVKLRQLRRRWVA